MDFLSNIDLDAAVDWFTVTAPSYPLEDDVEGTIDIRQIIDFTGIFSPLEDPDYFSQVAVNPELGTICWPNHADLDPDVLYAIVLDRPLSTYSEATAPL